LGGRPSPTARLALLFGILFVSEQRINHSEREKEEGRRKSFSKEKKRKGMGFRGTIPATEQIKIEEEKKGERRRKSNGKEGEGKGGAVCLGIQSAVIDATLIPRK